jgi:predicted nuclease with TOPRIM domain
MKRTIVALAALIAMAGPARAALDAEPSQKYQFRVVVRCGSHAWLGAAFRRDLCDDLGATLRAALGTLADVTVIDMNAVPRDQWEPLWATTESRGLAGLDTTTEFGKLKTHFLRLDYVSGHYELQARQHDGSTGILSRIRRERTADRQLVTRVATRMLAQDFGPVGAVIGTDNPVQVQLKGGSLGGPLDQWVHKGEVFALVKIVNARGGETRGIRIEDTLLVANDSPKNGVVECTVAFRGQENPLMVQGGSILGYRCIKLGTVAGPLRMRLVDDRGQAHTRTLQIRVHPQKFVTGESPDEEVINSDRGLFVSKKSYDHVAFVRVVTGARIIAQFPVDVADDRVATITVGVNAEQERIGQLQYAKNDLLRQINESIIVQNDRFMEGKKLMDLQRNDEALKKARASRQTLEEDVARLTANVSRLKSEIGGAPIKLEECESRIRMMQEFRVILNRRIGNLEELIAIQNDPTILATKGKLKTLISQGQSQEDQLDLDTAIATYQQIVKEFPTEPDTLNIRKRLEVLERTWAIQNEDHRAARKFVYQDWSALRTSADIAAKLPAARAAMATLRQVNDQFSLLKLQRSFPELGQRVANEVEQLLKDASPDEAKKNQIQKVIEDLAKFAQEVDEALSAKSGGKSG